MDIVAMYLPQFHRIKENDIWWGEGFTEWTAVKEAKSLYDGHIQPRAPLNNNYYDLIQKETMEWQTSLMHKYGIDGMCFYHYYFKGGKKILEKPAENLLKWKDIDMPFCFCWANETWARSWANIDNKNEWASTFEDSNNMTEGILLKQSYGKEEEWTDHFYYLLPFFKDKRYILKDEMPIFLIHKTMDVYCLDEMLECWKKLAKKNGLKGLYVIGANCRIGSSIGVDAKLQTEPGTSIHNLINKGLIRKDAPRRVSYDDIWDLILKSRPERDAYVEAFVDYDDTPRRGREGMAVENATPKKFGEYLSRLIAKSEINGNDMIFINAWNEWGEGMYLEPDVENQYGYLEAIKDARKNWEKYINEYGIEGLGDSSDHALKQLKDRIEINLQIMSKWLLLWEEGIKLSDYLISEHNTKEIIIHGYGVLGKHLYSELKNDGVKVRYVVEQNKWSVHIDNPVYTQEEVILNPVDTMVVITAMYYYDEIARIYKKHGFNNVISIDSLISGCIDVALR